MRAADTRESARQAGRIVGRRGSRLWCGAARRLIDDQDAVEDFAADAGLPAVTIRSIGRGGADQRP